MGRTLNFCIILIIGANLAYGQSLVSERVAYQYCKAEKKSYIAIVWPIAEGKDREIEELFNRYGEIKYKKTMRFNAAQAFYLLRKAHGRMPNMNAHVLWYFPPGTYEKEARIYVWKCSSHAKVLTCKHAIRGLFPLQWRSVHMNDKHEETVFFAKYFFQQHASRT